MSTTNSDELVKELENWIVNTLLEWTDFDPDEQIGMELSSKFSELRSRIKQERQTELDEVKKKAQREALARLINEMQLDMRLQFNSSKHDFSTFDAMLEYMNGWVADKLDEHKKLGK